MPYSTYITRKIVTLQLLIHTGLVDLFISINKSKLFFQNDLHKVRLFQYKVAHVRNNKLTLFPIIERELTCCDVPVLPPTAVRQTALCTRHPAVAGNSAIVLGVKCQVRASKATAGVLSECSVLYNMVGRAIKAQPSLVKTRP